MTSPGAPDFSGARLLQSEQVVLQKLNQTLAFGQSQEFDVNVIRPSYLIKLHLQNTTDATTIMPVRVDMVWVDTTLGTVMDRQRWNIFAGDNAGTHFVIGKGPCAGNQLKITVFNNAATPATLTYEIDIAETSNYFTVHDWRTDDSVSTKFPGYLQINSDVVANTIYQLDHFSLAAGTTKTWALPLFSGPATWNFDFSNGSLNGQAWLLNGSDVKFNANAFLYSIDPAALDAYKVPVFMPRSQALFQLASFTTTAAQVSSSTLIAGPVG